MNLNLLIFHYNFDFFFILVILAASWNAFALCRFNWVLLLLLELFVIASFLWFDDLFVYCRMIIIVYVSLFLAL